MSDAAETPYLTYGLYRCRPDKTRQASHQALQGAAI